MKKALLVFVILAATVLLSGCVVISFEESGRTRRVCTLGTPSHDIIRVVHVPCAEPRPRSRLLE